jgi:hypothetical protein
MLRELILLTFFLAVFSATSQAVEWQNICPDPSNYYCKDVGKSAYNAAGPQIMREIKLGKIIGVTWRPKGSIIGISPAMPKVGLPQQIRLSPRDSFYYIINDEWGEPFIRQCREITAR